MARRTHAMMPIALVMLLGAAPLAAGSGAVAPSGGTASSGAAASSGAEEEVIGVSPPARDAAPELEPMADPVEVKTFLTSAAQTNLTGIELGRLAVKQSQTPVVQRFAQAMIVEHTEAHRQLEALAKTHGISLPKAPANRRTADRLSSLTGAAFDKAYMSTMVLSHIQEIDLFHTASRGLEDDGLRTWAARAVPTLKSHLDRAREVRDRLTPRRETHDRTFRV